MPQSRLFPCCALAKKTSSSRLPVNPDPHTESRECYSCGNVKDAFEKTLWCSIFTQDQNIDVREKVKQSRSAETLHFWAVNANQLLFTKQRRFIGVVGSSRMRV